MQRCSSMPGAGILRNRRTCASRCSVCSLWAWSWPCSAPALQLWSLQLSLDARTAGNIFPALAAGLLAAFFLSRGPAKSVGPGTRVLFVASGVLAATALAAMSFVYAAAWLPGPMFVLGTALGCFAGAAAALLERILTPRRARGVLDLAAVSFCLGGLAGCLSIRAAAGFVSPAGILRALAVLPLLAAVAASRAWRLRLPLPSVVRESAGRPRTFSLNFFSGELQSVAAVRRLWDCRLLADGVPLARARPDDPRRHDGPGCLLDGFGGGASGGRPSACLEGQRGVPGRPNGGILSRLRVFVANRARLGWPRSGRRCWVWAWVLCTC